jgi:hypothetical protein
MDDERYRRYVRINLPHARTIVERIALSLERLGVLGGEGNGGFPALKAAHHALEEEAAPFDDDPPREQALAAADAIAERGRALVVAILATRARGDRLGQLVRTLFECLGLPEEGAALALQCGEDPGSPLR